MPKKPVCHQPIRHVDAADNADPTASHLKSLRDISDGNLTIMDGDDRLHYDEFCAGIVACLKPGNASETQLAEGIASDYWCLNRISTLEESIFSLGRGSLGQTGKTAAPGLTHTFLGKQADLKFLSQCETRAQRSLDRNKARLKHLQVDRAGLDSETDPSNQN